MGVASISLARELIMQTFLVNSSFSETAKCLDWRRLGCQRKEAKQILEINTIHKNKSRWYNHPACIQWRGYEWALCEYGTDMCLEWSRRGYEDNCYPLFLNLLGQFARNGFKDNFFVYPKFIQDERFLSSHRAALLAKNFDWYKQFRWKEEPKISYFWPSKELDNSIKV